jgi:hypothetical protein
MAAPSDFGSSDFTSDPKDNHFRNAEYIIFIFNDLDFLSLAARYLRGAQMPHCTIYFLAGC